MVNEDSLSDDDSFFDVYSAKKTTSTYNSFLEKIKAEYGALQEEKSVTEKDNKGELITSEATGSGSSTPERIDSDESSDSEITFINSIVSPPRVGNPFVQRTTRLNRQQRNRRSSTEALDRISAVNRRRRRQQRSPEIIELTNEEMDEALDRISAANGRRRRQRSPEIIELTNEEMDEALDRISAANGRRRRQRSPEIIELTNEEMDVLPQDLYVDEDSNYEVLVKVLWKSVNIKTFRLRRYQKFTEVFEYFVKKENVPYEQILLHLRDTKINITDTPESVNLKVCDFIEGGVLSDEMVPQSQIPLIDKMQSSENPIDENHLIIKIQSENKGFHKFSIHKKDSFQNVMMKYAEKVECPLENIKFYYDGDALKPSDTPGFLGMEHDEIIDAVLKK